MATNHAIVADDTYSLPVASTVTSGQLVAVGSLIGVAQVDASQGTVSGADGLRATVYFTGIHKFTTADAVTVGAPIYAATSGLATGTSAVTVTATSATLVGYAVEAKASGAGNVFVRLHRV